MAFRPVQKEPCKQCPFRRGNKTRKKRGTKRVDPAAIAAAREIVDRPNTGWDEPRRRDEVLAVARALLLVSETP